MYLSQCVLKTARPVNPYLLHTKIWRLFPEQNKQLRTFLFRVENLGQTGNQKILLQSQYEPQPDSGDLVLQGTKKVSLDGVLNQSRLRFMIRANPTKKIKDPTGKLTNQGKLRVPLINEREIMDWLKRQLQDCVDIDESEISIIRQDLLSFRKAKSGEQHFGKIQTVTYTGLMTISDHLKLKGKINLGIGPGKAFGCGLLSLART